MGAGMVHRNVFEAVKYNPTNGRALLLEWVLRLTMIKYNIPDIRLFCAAIWDSLNSFNVLTRNYFFLEEAVLDDLSQGFDSWAAYFPKGF